MTTPNHLPRYAVLTGHVGDTFNRQVSKALDMGYELHGSLAVTFNGKRTILAQAVIWTKLEEPPTNPESNSMEFFEMPGQETG
mgnify:CR=1 FL=1